MTKQIITESELKARIASLKETMAAVEDAASIGQTVGNVAGTAAGLASALPRAGVAAGQAVASKAGDLWNQAKAGVANAAQGAVQGVQNFAQGVAGGAKQGWAATDPAKLVGGQQSAAKPGTTTGGKPDPAVMKIQQDLIAKGAKIKADGIMGPATQAAQKQFGGQAAATPQTQTQQNFAAAGMAGQEMRTPAEIAASQDMSSANDGSTTSGAAAQARNPNAGLTPDDPRWQGPKPTATAAAPAAAPAAPTATESVYKDMDTLARIVQLSR